MEENIHYSYQQCQDVDLTEAFRELHRKIVSEVLEFCKEHKLEIDEFGLSADGLRGATMIGERSRGAVGMYDTSFSMYKFEDDTPRGETEPFLWSI